ncbi:hypothetical protein FRB97_002050 [Tulasnella sp. 331]|nr:hypothetical protein FRB97_002050 [Tulasnella sp. 331]
MRVTVVEAKKIHADKKQLQEWLPQAVAESLAVAEQAHRLRRGDRDPIAMCLTTGIEWIFALLVNLEDGSKVLIRSQSLLVTLSPACWKTDSTAATQLKKEVYRVMLYLLAWVSLGCADVLDVLKGSLSKKASTELFGSK